MPPFISYASAGHGEPQKCLIAQRQQGSMLSTFLVVTSPFLMPDESNQVLFLVGFDQDAIVMWFEMRIDIVEA